ncbi:MAG: hypothetical protein QOI49_645 [Verrucomicrobiota bacterium]|jgi:hypothetical protein
MDDIEEIADQLDRAWGGKTLETLREEATRELNGTSLSSLRWPAGPRRILIICLTGQYELRKLGSLQPQTARSFADWSSVSLFEATVVALSAGGFAYTFAGKSLASASAVILIAAASDSVAILEGVFQLEAIT